MARPLGICETNHVMVKVGEAHPEGAFCRNWTPNAPKPVPAPPKGMCDPSYHAGFKKLDHVEPHAKTEQCWHWEAEAGEVERQARTERERCVKIVRDWFDSLDEGAVNCEDLIQKLRS